MQMLVPLWTEIQRSNLEIEDLCIPIASVSFDSHDRLPFLL